MQWSKSKRNTTSPVITGSTQTNTCIYARVQREQIYRKPTNIIHLNGRNWGSDEVIRNRCNNRQTVGAEVSVMVKWWLYLSQRSWRRLRLKLLCGLTRPRSRWTDSKHFSKPRGTLFCLYSSKWRLFKLVLFLHNHLVCLSYLWVQVVIPKPFHKPIHLVSVLCLPVTTDTSTAESSEHFCRWQHSVWCTRGVVREQSPMVLLLLITWSDSHPLSRTNGGLSVRYSVIQEAAEESMCIFRRFSLKKTGWIVLKTLECCLL